MQKKDENIVWHPPSINKVARQLQNGHKSCALWFTGLSGSGKSTIANALQERLFQDHFLVYLLDGDNLRHGINNNLGFTAEGRKENIRRAAEVSRLFVDAGFITLTSLISPYKEDRDIARSLFDEGEFIEIYVECPLDECEKRDPKGLYRRARNGEIKQFTGIDAPYEEPRSAEVVLNTAAMSVDECVETLLDFLINKMKIKIIAG